MIRARFDSRRALVLARRALLGEASLGRRAERASLGRRAERALGRVLRESEENRRAYDALARLVRALEGRPEAGLTTAQEERILGRLLDRAEIANGPVSVGPRSSWLAPALAVLLIALLLLVLPRSAPDERHRWQARGSTAAASWTGRIGLRAFCVRDGRLVTPPRAAPGTPLEARCRIDDELQLVVTHEGPAPPQLLVIGQQAPAQHGLWYYPVPPTGRSGPAPAGIEQPLGRAVRLSVNHRPGRVRIVAVFSRLPLEGETLRAWLRTLSPEEPATPLLERVGAGAGLQAVEVQLVIEEGPR